MELPTTCEAIRTSGDTVCASRSNSPFSRLEREFPEPGNIEENREEGPSGLLSDKSSEPMICEVSNQIKDLMEVIKTLASNQQQARDKLESLGAEVNQLQRGDARCASTRPHERSSSQQSEGIVDAEIRARDEQWFIAQQELD